MPKTNYQRNFRDKRDYSIDNAIRLAWKVGVSENDFVKGKHGCARSKRGLKKFKNSRARIANKEETKNQKEW